MNAGAISIAKPGDWQTSQCYERARERKFETRSSISYGVSFARLWPKEARRFRVPGVVELISDFAISSLPGLSGLGIQSREELGLHAGCRALEPLA